MKDMELGQILKIIFQSVYYRLKISKKDGQFFFRLKGGGKHRPRSFAPARFSLTITLKDWKQLAVVNRCKSQLNAVKCGIPQGSLLGPRLFSF